MATSSDPDDEFDPYYVYEALTEMIPDPTERGRGWVYFDDILNANGTCLQHYILVSGTNAHGDQCLGTPEQSNRITVYDSTVSGVISDQNYMVDYIDGRIVTSGTVTPAYVSYHWNYVSVVDEWAAIEAADPPVVVIDIRGTDKGGYQFGGGKKNTRKVDLHIFASNTAERNDIVETLYDGLYLKGCPLYELSTGSVLDYDGTFYGRRYGMNKLTSLFCRRIISDTSRLQFENVVARHVNLPLLMTRSRDEVMLSDLNAYRSKISFDMISYTGGANDTNDPYDGYGGT
jgi:hypothetical protein